MKWRLLRGNAFTYEKIPPQEPPLHARSSSIPRIRIGSIWLWSFSVSFLSRLDFEFKLDHVDSW